jgi:hypothetical protein
MGEEDHEQPSVFSRQETGNRAQELRREKRKSTWLKRFAED